LADWALAEEVHRLSARLVAIGNTMKDQLGLPSEVEMVNLQSQLSIAKQATKDRVGLLIVGDLLNEAVALLGIRVRYDKAGQCKPVKPPSGSIRVRDNLQQCLAAL